MLDMSAEGKEYEPFSFQIERCKIKEMCMAIGDKNPIFYDKNEAVKQGYKDTPVPLTFGTVINFWGYPEIWDRMKEIGVNVQRLLHANEEYEYIQTIYPGDIITGKVMVEAMRSSSMMDVVTFKSTYTRNNETVMIAKMKIVVMTGDK